MADDEDGIFWWVIRRRSSADSDRLTSVPDGLGRRGLAQRQTGAHWPSQLQGRVTIRSTYLLTT